MMCDGLAYSVKALKVGEQGTTPTEGLEKSGKTSTEFNVLLYVAAV